MVRYSGTIKTAHNRARVWELISDWSNLALWDMNVKANTPRAGTPTSGVGAEWDCKFEFNGTKTDARYRCVEWDAERRAVFEASSTFVRSRDTIEVADVPGGGTAVTAEFQLYLRGILSPFSFVLNGAMQDTCPKVMKDLTAFIEERLASKS